MSQKNILICGCNPYNVNRGVGALAYSIFFILNEISKEENIDFNYFVTSEYQSSEINIKGNEIQYTNITIPSLSRKRSFLRLVLFPKNIRQLLSIDCVMGIGAGDSFSDIYGLRRFNLINDPYKLFRMLKKKLMLLPQTVGPFKSERVAKEAKKSLENAEVVMVRDNQSYNYVAELLPQKKVTELIDIAFFMPFVNKEYRDDRIHVGINISALLWNGGYTKDNQFSLRLNYKDLMRKVINKFLIIPHVLIHLVPHVVSDKSGIENDYEISRIVMEEIGDERIVLAPFFLDPIEAKSYISGLDFFTGARMHACIAAFSSGVAVYPMAYSRKFNGLFVDTLGYDHIGDLLAQTDEDVCENLFDAFENRDAIQGDIKKTNMERIAPKYEQIKGLIKDFLEL